MYVVMLSSSLLLLLFCCWCCLISLLYCLHIHDSPFHFSMVMRYEWCFLKSKDNKPCYRCMYFYISCFGVAQKCVSTSCVEYHACQQRQRQWTPLILSLSSKTQRYSSLFFSWFVVVVVIVVVVLDWIGLRHRYLPAASYYYDSNWIELVCGIVILLWFEWRRFVMFVPRSVLPSRAMSVFQPHQLQQLQH